jgi:hypothetical protein
MITQQGIEQGDVVNKAFNNAWHVLVGEPQIESIPKIFKKNEMKLNFIEIYKLLYSKSRGDIDFMKHWFSCMNKELNSTPQSLCLTEKGLIAVTEYLKSSLRK